MDPCKILFQVPEIDGYIFNYLNLNNLINLLSTNSKNWTRVKNFPEYLEIKKFYQDFPKLTNNIHKIKYEIFVDYFIIACRQNKPYTKFVIQHLTKKYNLVNYYFDGFIDILYTKNLELIIWYYTSFSPNQDFDENFIFVLVNLNFDILSWLFNQPYYNKYQNMLTNSELLYQSLNGNNFDLFQELYEYYNKNNIFISDQLKINLLNITCDNRQYDILKWLLNNLNYNPTDLNLVYSDLFDPTEIYLKKIIHEKIYKTELPVSLSDYFWLICFPLNFSRKLISKFISDNINNLTDQDYYEILNYAVLHDDLKITKLICRKVQIKIEDIRYLMEICTSQYIRDFLLDKYGLENLTRNKKFSYNFNSLKLKSKYFDHIRNSKITNLESLIILKNILGFDDFINMVETGPLEVINLFLSIHPNYLKNYRSLLKMGYKLINKNILVWFLDNNIIPLEEILINFPRYLNNKNKSWNFLEQILVITEYTIKNNQWNILRIYIDPISLFNLVLKLSREFSREIYKNYPELILIDNNIKIWLDI